MTHRIAVASSDGKYIDLHFGHADRFIIVDVNSEGYITAETRQCDPACRGFDHDTSSFDAIAALLHDCEAIFVSRIGRAAAQYLFVKGVRAFEAPYFIEDVLNKIVYEHLLDKGDERNVSSNR
jgi:nitrogen fixation protein NifX